MRAPDRAAASGGERLIFNPTERRHRARRSCRAGRRRRACRQPAFVLGVSGQWPVAERWEGTAVIEESTAVGLLDVRMYLTRGLIFCNALSSFR